MGNEPEDRGVASAGWPRRDVVRTLAAAGLAGGLQRPWVVTRRGPPRGGRTGALGPDPAVVIDGTAVRALALRVLDAAKAAGASYADVRLTRRLRQTLVPDIAIRTEARLKFSALYLRLNGAHERLGVGVRVRVGNGWGFASSPYWDLEDVVRLATEAAAQAKANARASGAAVEWVPIPVATGHWTTPIKVDPFVISLEEKIDVLDAWRDAAYRLPRGVIGAQVQADFTREERALATSEGTYVTQTFYTSEGKYEILRTTTRGSQHLGGAVAQGLGWAPVGWELFAEADIPGQLPRIWEEADPLKSGGPAVASKPGDIGRYEVVFDARSMGALLERTLGVATQLDRALGLEANAGGTSYLGPDPLALLGSYQAASSAVTVTATRSLPRGMATVQWDDEGVVPEAFPLVKEGILVDYQTTRGQAPWLAPYYQKMGRPVRSHGCAGAESALDITLQQMPNLVLEPGKDDVGFDELVASVKKGLAVMDADPRTDFQARTGQGGGEGVREIVNGKLGAVVEGLIFTFSAPNLWKNVEALGGARSAVQYATSFSKGQPEQQTAYSVRAVPAKVKDVDFITPPRWR